MFGGIWLEALNLLGDSLVAAEKVRQRDNQRDAVLAAGHVKDAVQGAPLFSDVFILFQAEAGIVGIGPPAGQQLVRSGEDQRGDALVGGLLGKGHVQ